ncbi:hypothetical protein QVD99_006404 [Batrachochytrium dendrobatidis]|nr:hypothetical protein QVD99_006404 [Batrachochytrium dendrobatidis]
MDTRMVKANLLNSITTLQPNQYNETRNCCIIIDSACLLDYYANPIDPSATTDVESSIFPDLPSATTDVESSIFPDLPSATTDVETSTSTVIPSATTSTEASTLPTPNPNGIGLGGLDPLPDSIKSKNTKSKVIRNEQKKICDSLRFQYDNQNKLVTDLETKIQVLEEKSQRSGGSPEYDGEIQKTKIDLEAQKSKLEDLGSRYNECDSKHDSIKFGLRYRQ